MQDMTREFNNPTTVNNISAFLGEKESEYLPHGVTVNEYFKRLNSDELQRLIQEEVYNLVRKKVLMKPDFIVDGTQCIQETGS